MCLERTLMQGPAGILITSPKIDCFCYPTHRGLFCLCMSLHPTHKGLLVYLLYLPYPTHKDCVGMLCRFCVFRQPHPAGFCKPFVYFSNPTHRDFVLGTPLIFCARISARISGLRVKMLRGAAPPRPCVRRWRISTFGMVEVAPMPMSLRKKPVCQYHQIHDKAMTTCPSG